jgi:N-dimethylarginine dimethylaminohydrolase
MTNSDWGVDSEYGRLHDVLLCRPEHYRWLPTSAISRATIDSGRKFDVDRAKRQHAEMVSAYEGAGVRCHFLEPDPHLAYQLFTRDSSVMTTGGAVITQLNQWWRRGEYAPAIRFYQESGIPIRGMITAASLEGGDVMVVEPGCVVIGNSDDRTQSAGAHQLAAWLRAEGWEVRIEAIPSQFVHIDVLMASLAPKLAAVCVEAASGGLVGWLRGKGIEILDVPLADVLDLGVNGISLGDDRVLSSSHASSLNEQLRSRGLEVLDPELDMFTLGGGGPHCLAQALRRDRAG